MLVSVLPALIIIGLLVYAAIDCLQTPAGELRFGRGLWLTVIVLVPALGPVAWLLYGRSPSPRRHARSTVEAAPPEPTGHPVGPDDDPDFLAQLNRARRPEPPKAPGPPGAENPKPPPKKPKDPEPVDEPIDPDASA